MRVQTATWVRIICETNVVSHDTEIPGRAQKDGRKSTRRLAEQTPLDESVDRDILIRRQIAVATAAASTLD